MIEEFKPFSVDGAINQQAIEKTFDLREKQGDMKARKPLLKLAMSIRHSSMTLKNNGGGSKSQSTKTSHSGR